MSERDYAERTYSRYLESGYEKVHSLSDAEYEFYARFFRKNYAPHLPANRAAPILDAGCGTGQFLHFLQREGYTNYLGVDLSQQCLQRCAERGLRAERADIFELLEGADRRYHAIVCNEFLEHLDRDRALRLSQLCHGALDCGGVLLVKVPNMACPVAACRSRYVDLTHETGYTDHSLRTLLILGGFGDVSIVGPDIYVTRNPAANLAGRLLFRGTAALYRALELLYGIRVPHLMTKSILAIARK